MPFANDLYSCFEGGDDLNQSGNKSDLLDDEEDFFDFISRYCAAYFRFIFRFEATSTDYFVRPSIRTSVRKSQLARLALISPQRT